MKLVPLKVKIGLRPNGHADHPDWYKMAHVLDKEPSEYMHHGWKYDRSCGHKEHSEESPAGMQWGLLFVEPVFARAALKHFKEICSVMTESEVQDFWDNKLNMGVPRYNTNDSVLRGLQAEFELKKLLGEPITGVKKSIKKALDKEDPHSGVTPNRLSKWEWAKADLQIEVVDEKHTG